MSDKRYEANIIRATAVEPANNLESTSAPGVWSIDEVVELQKKSKWPTVGNVATNVDSLFSTFLYEGTGSAQVIQNGIALGNSNAGSSVEFAGGSGTQKQSLSYANNSNYVVGSSNNFTIEFFVFLRATNDNLAFGLLSGYNAYLTGIYISSGTLSGYFQTGASAQTQVATGQSLAAGQFYHIALVRNGTAFAVYLDGTSVGTSTSSSNIHNASQFFSIGNYSNNDGDTINGFVSNFRYSSTARYTGNFTPTTSNFTSDSDTILLSCQGQTSDLSSNSIAVTEGGSSPTLNDNFGPFTGTGGEGGLVWTKDRDTAVYHALTDTVRGGQYTLYSPVADAQVDRGNDFITSFNSNGYSIGADGLINDTRSYVSWTFRKQTKFFDIVTYTGNNATQTINHNLGSVPGMVIVKRLNDAGNWGVKHRSIAATNAVFLNLTDQSAANSTYWGDTEPTSTQFTVGTTHSVDSAPYVAYVFAHNNNDGGFGPDQDEDIIKCGSFTSDSSGIATVDLGFEPQWVLFKGTHAGSSWFLIDVMRGMTNGSNDAWLAANLTNAEGTTNTVITPTPTGFVTDGTNIVDPSSTFIYMAIRRPQAAPTAASQVFGIDTQGSTTPKPPGFKSGFSVDFAIRTNTSTSFNKQTHTRLLGDNFMATNLTDAEASYSTNKFDYQDGYFDSTTVNSSIYAWMWKRARGYFDVVCYTGSGSNRTITHNLGVAPEMMWVKKRNSSTNSSWLVYHSGTGNGKYLVLNTNAATVTQSTPWNDTDPTSTVFSLGTKQSVNNSGDTYIAYLFATLAGISKVGSYTGSGATKTIDCGFSSGARFVLIKRADASNEWYIFDTVRGITTTSNDGVLRLNSVQAQYTEAGWVGADMIQPDNSGFKLTSNVQLNANTGTYIFYAIA